MSPKLTALQFLEYIRAFNKKDYPVQHAFYRDDVELMLPDPTVDSLKGKPAIIQHYNKIHEDAEEAVIPITILSDRNKIFMQMEAYFKFKKEVQRSVMDYHVHPGDVLKLTCCAIYDLDEEGKMKRIEGHLFNHELLGDVDMKEGIKESESRADEDLRLFNY
ncbi:hypothetical protein NKR23_g4075 [Pleurostoma richardsiae]|uniref:SnoaL-like domain-containing protein n=1 Tax=Pleurostoma richardsiae TaxID=41990 RepID=A0AA38RWN3_9PEZI|nr:hypothetical protein NKR23_g4075 [Pleurostoma richardsiae]